MKKSVAIFCCVLMFLMCSCGNTEAQNPETGEFSNNVVYDSGTEEASTSAAEESEPAQNAAQNEQSDENNEQISLSYKYLSKYELASIMTMEKIVEFDWDSWAAQLERINTAGLSKEDILAMLQTEMDWDNLLKTNDTDKLDQALDQFMEMYDYREFLYTEEVMEMFQVKLDAVLTKAEVTDEEWQDFRQVFEAFQVEEDDIWDVYSEAKDIAWEEYDQQTDAAWEEYDLQKTSLWNEYSAKKEEISADYDKALGEVRQEYFETSNLAKYEEEKDALQAAREQALDDAWDDYSIQKDGGDGVESLFSQYTAKKDAAWQLYKEKESAADQIRVDAVQEAFKAVEAHPVYQKIYQISDSEIWKNLLITIGER